MRAWESPAVPALPGRGEAPRLFDHASGSLRLAAPEPGQPAKLYVCGITPYDATHLGHAATYVAFDTLVRVWRDAGFDVAYAQNVTDVDDPLLERARTTRVDWRTLAAEQVELFRRDMAALRVVPPTSYVAVTDIVGRVGEAVAELAEAGLAYRVGAADASGDDLYLDLAAVTDATRWRPGLVSRLGRDTMLSLFAERGGDPDRAGKRDRLDPLLWRAERAGEPAWASPVGRGRPGWHIECSVIAIDELDVPVTVQGGGADLVFPHHDLGAGHTAALAGRDHARLYAYAGLVSYQGEKMSKSLGNLVLVSHLLERGTDARAIRLAILANHYRSEWEWTDAALEAAEKRLAAWEDAAQSFPPVDGAAPPLVDWAAQQPDGDQAPSATLTDLRAALADDLDTPAALRLLDEAFASGRPPADLVPAVDALLGIRLRSREV